MSQSFSYSVKTALDRERVWDLLQNLENWQKASDVYGDLHWVGPPWVRGSSVQGTLKFPIHMWFRYVLENCEPPARISYSAHSMESGFATHRTVELEAIEGGTWIKIHSYAVGEAPMNGGAMAFLKMLTERWFNDFARFCDEKAKASKRKRSP